MPCIHIPEREAKKLEPSTATGSISTKAFISQPIASPHSKNMTAGYIQLDAGYAKEFQSPVDEIDLFLEGSLTYTCEGKTFTAQKGDIVFIERGSRVRFMTDKGCIGFFVTYPLMRETVEELQRKGGL